MKEAMFYDRNEGLKVRCILCAHTCVISEGKRGLCGVRENVKGKLYSLVYGKLISMNIDPVEKKPLFHLCPASTSFSIATIGCNFRCKHCQNYDIAQYSKEHDNVPGEEVTPEQVVEAADKAGCKSISYTYTEPTVFFEFAYECAKRARNRGIKNVFVSNGYTGTDAAKTIIPYLDANNIDLKGDDQFYKKICGARLQPVLDTINLMKDSGVWVEITTLIIPSYNDSDEVLGGIIEFIMSVDPAIPWHVTQFYPTHEILDQPRTPVDTLNRARDMGLAAGLKYVYEGNVPGQGGENTYCPKCGELLIERIGYTTTSNISDGSCHACNEKIDGVWR